MVHRQGIESRYLAYKADMTTPQDPTQLHVITGEHTETVGEIDNLFTYNITMISRSLAREV